MVGAECSASGRKHAPSVFVCRIEQPGALGPLSIEQEAFQAFNELVAAREMTPGLRQTVIVTAQNFVGCFGCAQFSNIRLRQTVCDVVAEFLQHGTLPRYYRRERNPSLGHRRPTPTASD